MTKRKFRDQVWGVVKDIGYKASGEAARYGAKRLIGSIPAKKRKVRIRIQKKPYPRRHSRMRPSSKISTSDVHSGTAKNAVKIVLHKLPSRVKTIGRWTYQQMHSGSLFVAAGYQGAYTMFTVGSLAQVLNSNGTGFSRYQNYKALREMNPYQPTLAIPGISAAPNKTLTGAPKDDRFCILGHTFDLEFSNFENAAAYLDIYILKAKQVCVDYPEGLWNLGLGDEALDQSVVAALVPGTSNPTIGVPTYNFAGQKPTDVKVFKEFWHICDKRSIDLAGGSNERLTFYIKNQNVVKIEEYLKWDPGTNSFAPRTTLACLAVWRGQIIDDITFPLVPLPTYAAVKIGWVGQITTNLCGVRNNTGRLNIHTLVNAIPQGTLLANQQFTSVTDAVVSVAAA